MYLVETKEGHPVNELQKQKEQIRSLEERVERMEAALQQISASLSSRQR